MSSSGEAEPPRDLVGQVAPDFALRDQHGQSVRLSEHGGTVLLVFYPHAFSRVCTRELHELRDASSRLRATGARLLAVSCDPMFALRAFADYDGLSFPLLSDFWPHGEVSRAYGAFDESSGSSTRSSFVIDAEGRVRWAVRRARPEARSLEEYFTALGALAEVRPTGMKNE